MQIFSKVTHAARSQPTSRKIDTNYLAFLEHSEQCDDAVQVAVDSTSGCSAAVEGRSGQAVLGQAERGDVAAAGREDVCEVRGVLRTQAARSQAEVGQVRVVFDAGEQAPPSRVAERNLGQDGFL